MRGHDTYRAGRRNTALHTKPITAEWKDYERLYSKGAKFFQLDRGPVRANRAERHLTPAKFLRTAY
jgi:hypothetical protein